MNPLRIARNLREDYLRLLRTTFQPRQERLREAFEREIAREGFLTREPFIALASPHQYGPPLTELLEETRRRFSPIADHSFAHQAEACRRILRGEPVVIATGTGSGKTEAFLMPIVDHCLRHRDEPGPKVVLVYKRGRCIISIITLLRRYVGAECNFRRGAPGGLRRPCGTGA
jgi:ATP-dependent helicase YprA (DUF1998 family)